MKECKKVKKILSRYLDKETTNTEAIQVLIHFDKCFLCKNEFLELSRIKNLISHKERKILPQGYLVSHLQKETTRVTATEESFLLSNIGNLARKLIPVPVTVIALSIIFMFLSSTQKTSKYSLEENILCGSPATTETALKLILGV